MRDAESKLCVVGKDSVRSMLERRWLLFFKRMNIDFEYEPERFPDGVSNIGYLPDMLIHGELYLEIKPTVEIAREEIRKPYGFVRETNGFYYRAAVVYKRAANRAIRPRMEGETLNVARGQEYHDLYLSAALDCLKRYRRLNANR